MFDVTPTWVLLAIGFAVLLSAFGLVVQIEDAAFSWPAVLVLVLSVVLFLGCAVFSLRLAWVTFRSLRRVHAQSSEGGDASHRRRRQSGARDGAGQ